MSLPSTYSDKNCSIARSLEVVGERWTLLIVRDAFYGVRRFSDFATQLGIPRAVLTNRLKSLVAEGVLAREHNTPGPVEYRLTDKGEALWPALRALMSWGDTHYSPRGPKRVLLHDADGGALDHEGRCQTCNLKVPVPETRVTRGPGFDESQTSADPVSAAIDTGRLLLEPLA